MVIEHLLTLPILQQQENGRTPQHGCVIELHTAKDRDILIAASPKLKNLTAAMVFGEGGNSSVSIRQLWPKEIHSTHSFQGRSESLQATSISAAYS